MNIYIPTLSDKVRYGGGWSFLSNFVKALDWATIVFDPNQADIVFLPGATMVDKHIDIAPNAKVVLRVDNALKNSRNRNGGMDRMRRFADKADLIVYQSNWAYDYLMPVISNPDKKSAIIINGVDTSIFNPNGPKLPGVEDYPLYLYIRSSNDETKQWHQAWYDYQIEQRKHPDAMLFILGKFSPENNEYNFDFFNGENYEYHGFIDTPETMAAYFRTADTLLLPFFNDACSNTLIEARLCGMTDIRCNQTGGNPDILEAPLEDLTIEAMSKRYKEAFEAIL